MTKERYVAVPTEGDFLHSAIEWNVPVEDIVDGDSPVTLTFNDKDEVLKLAKICLDHFLEGEGPLEIGIQGRILAKNFNHEELTDEEAEVFSKRFYDRMELLHAPK